MQTFTIFADSWNEYVCAVANSDPDSTRTHLVDDATGAELRPAGEVCALNESDALDIHYRNTQGVGV